MIPIPEHGACFTCGSHPKSIGIQWYLTEQQTITGTIALTEGQQGPPGFAHGGASAALTDEAMGACVWASGKRVVAIGLNVAYQRPVPLGTEVTINGWIDHTDADGLTHTAAEIVLPSGKVAVTATGIYKEAPSIFDAQVKANGAAGG